MLDENDVSQMLCLAELSLPFCLLSSSPAKVGSEYQFANVGHTTAC